MPQSTPIAFRDDPVTRRITQVVQHAADLAYRARIDRAIERRFGAGDLAALTKARREAGITEERWIALNQSTRQAASPGEFQAFARVLSVSPRWLSIGSGWIDEPPTGWFPFGSHVDRPDVNQLEFSKELDDGLMPLWERPLEAVPA